MKSGLSATTQALRRLGHSYRCIAAARGVSTRTVWLSVSSRTSGGRTPWAHRAPAERATAVAAAYVLLTTHECRCLRVPNVPSADALQPGDAAYGV